VYDWCEDEVFFCCEVDVPMKMGYNLGSTLWEVTENPFLVENTRTNNKSNLNRLGKMDNIIKSIILMDTRVVKNTTIVPNIDKR
jgi:hypothetical protein